MLEFFNSLPMFFSRIFGIPCGLESCLRFFLYYVLRSLFVCLHTKYNQFSSEDKHVSSNQSELQSFEEGKHKRNNNYWFSEVDLLSARG